MFKENIKELRIKNILTQQELANIIGVSRSTISAWENGTIEVNLATLTKLRDYFDVSYEELID